MEKWRRNNITNDEKEGLTVSEKPRRLAEITGLPISNLFKKTTSAILL